MKEIKNLSTSETNVILEQNQRFSQSLLWKLQRSYFEHQGMQAWSQGDVPQFITTNSFIAKAYSHVVLGFLQDNQSLASSMREHSQPIYIIELGSGSGRFAYHFLKHFLAVLRQSAVKDVSFKYILTDFSMGTLEVLQTHPSLQPFIEQDILDFALFDAERPQDLVLLSSGNVLSAAIVTQPIILLANYFFDSIPQDCFTLQDGQLAENLLTISSVQAEVNLSDPTLLTRLKLDYQNHPISTNYYDDPDFNQILQKYQEHLVNTTFLFPDVGLRCIQYFRNVSDGNFLLLTADKGYVRESDMLDQTPPVIALHGSFSLMVNYHALGEYFRNQGGLVLERPDRFSSLNISASLLGQHPNSYLETIHAFNNAIQQWGPDDFFTLRIGMIEACTALNIKQLLAYLRMSAWDSDVFVDCYSTLHSQLVEMESVDWEVELELHHAIQQVWNMYYYIGENSDLPYRLGVLTYILGYYVEALEYFEHSLSLHGLDVDTLYNMSVCYYDQKHWEKALEYIDKVLELDAEHEAAKVKQIKIHSMLRW